MVSNEEKLLKDRIKLLLAHKNMTIKDISDDGDQYKRLRNQINGEALVPYSTLHKLLYMFHDISADWLVMGEGSMKKVDCIAPKVYHHNEVRDSSAGGSIHVGTSTIPYPVQALLDEKDKRISELEQDKQLLSNILSAITKPK